MHEAYSPKTNGVIAVCFELSAILTQSAFGGDVASFQFRAENAHQFQVEVQKWGVETDALMKAAKMKLQHAAVKEFNFILFSHIRFCL